LTNYHVNLNFQGQPNTNDNLLNIINDVAEDDELVVDVSADNHSKIANITSILDENGFEHITKGNGEGRQLSIIAHLKKS